MAVGRVWPRPGRAAKVYNKPIRIVGAFIEIRNLLLSFPTNKIRKRYRVSRVLHRLDFVFDALELLDCDPVVLNLYVKSVMEIKYDIR
jgi:hypothetical protein